MDESTITVRYAKAIFSLAKEKNQLLPLKEDMNLILRVCNQSEDFILLLKSPVVKTSEKAHIIRLIFQEKISSLSLRFLEMVIQKNREVFIPSMCRNVLTLIRKENNIKIAVITTAQAMDDKLLEKAEKILEKGMGSKIELSAKVNPKLKRLFHRLTENYAWRFSLQRKFYEFTCNGSFPVYWFANGIDYPANQVFPNMNRGNPLKPFYCIALFYFLGRAKQHRTNVILFQVQNDSFYSTFEFNHCV